MSIQPFKINVPEARIDRLRQKLALSDFPNDTSAHSWDYGAPVADVKRLAKVWQASFDWRKAEAHLNTFPQFIAPIAIDVGTYQVHHIHKRSTQLNALPLLYLHGWPSSFVEVTKMIDELVRGAGGPAFHVVAPSLMDFGFSSAGGPGFTLDNHAEVYDKLMQRLGYNEYVIEAGDVGYLITRYLVKMDGPSRCKAYHTNTTQPGPPDPKLHPEVYAKAEANPLSDLDQQRLQQAGVFAKEGLGYFKQQATRPQTLGFSLRDSPVGLLAWLYEKLHDWSDEYPWTDDEILTWVSIYYFSTAGPEASSNIYYVMEHSEPPAFEAIKAYNEVPFGVTRFAGDVVMLPKLWNQTLGPVVFENEEERGGHFASWERPDVMVKDLRSMFTSFSFK